MNGPNDFLVRLGKTMPIVDFVERQDIILRSFCIFYAARNRYDIILNTVDDDRLQPMRG
jgi:hypothetical protein